MLAKLISWGETREIAAGKLNLALNDILFLGVQTNRDYLKRILTLPEFHSGKTYTHFVKTYEDKLQKKQPTKEQRALAVAAFLLKKDSGPKTSNSHSGSKTNSIWESLAGFRNI